eukprot:scaffold70918_cov63-Phaeocystis_antarctica.AAC.1
MHGMPCVASSGGEAGGFASVGSLVAAPLGAPVSPPSLCPGGAQGAGEGGGDGGASSTRGGSWAGAGGLWAVAWGQRRWAKCTVAFVTARRSRQSSAAVIVQGAPCAVVLVGPSPLAIECVASASVVMAGACCTRAFIPGSWLRARPPSRAVGLVLVRLARGVVRRVPVRSRRW